MTFSIGQFLDTNRGDADLGGEHFDNAVLNWCLDQSNPKMQMYTKSFETTHLPNFVSDALSKMTNMLHPLAFLTKFRATYEELNAVLFSLYNMFGLADVFNCSIHPDEAVAHGAAVQGHILATGGTGGGKDLAWAEMTTNLLLLDVTPLSLGIELQWKQICKKTRTYTPVDDWQTTLHLLVLPMVFSNVSACDQVTGAEARAEITAEKGRLTSDGIDQMIADAEKYRAQDEEISAKTAYRTTWKKPFSLYRVRNEQANEVKELADLMDWLELDSETASSDEMKKRGRAIEDTWGYIVA
ncbi:LOW QUALITY PROTEIN: hypothetical protein ACHAWX_005386 [Stephanocyclus meneghinianus]